MVAWRSRAGTGERGSEDNLLAVLGFLGALIMPQMHGEHFLPPCWDQIPESGQLGIDGFILSESGGMHSVSSQDAET